MALAVDPQEARTHDALMASPLWMDMARTEQAWLLSIGEPVHLLRGDFLYRRAASCNRAYILVSGHMKLSIPSGRGQEKVIEFLEAGDVFGESVLLPGNYLIADAQALEPCDLLSFKRHDLQAAIARVPSFAQKWLVSLAKRFDALLRDIESASLLSAAQRVAQYLLQQPRIGNQTKLVFHKRAIASKLGLQPETFSRSLQQLAADGLISVRGSRVVIHDPVRLQSLLV
jgi:CRP/FNR family transcriptional regulator, dissimilatory nitrate respiration regulator